MPEHLIRLRGGWERLGLGDNARTTRVALPLVALPEAPRRARFARSFQSPPLDPHRESLWLRLDSVPGLIAVFLNDHEIAQAPFPAFPWLLPLGDALPARNRITLDVEFPDPPNVPGAGFHWGEVGLLIRVDDER